MAAPQIGETRSDLQDVQKRIRELQKDIHTFIASGRPTHIWVHEPTPDVNAALGVQLAAGSSYLLARQGDGWRAVSSWPHPPDRP